VTEREVQSQFFEATGLLIAKVKEMGYQATWGHAWRSPACAVGSKSSKHKRRLAVDVNLFRDGVYLEGTEDHRPLGEWWESIGGEWGGRFDDGNHYQWPSKGV